MTRDLQKCDCLLDFQFIHGISCPNKLVSRSKQLLTLIRLCHKSFFFGGGMFDQMFSLQWFVKFYGIECFI